MVTGGREGEGGERGRLEKVGGARGLALFNGVGVRTVPAYAPAERRPSQLRPAPASSVVQRWWRPLTSFREPRPANRRGRAIVRESKATLPHAHRPVTARVRGSVRPYVRSTGVFLRRRSLLLAPRFRTRINSRTGRVVGVEQAVCTRAERERERDIVPIRRVARAIRVPRYASRAFLASASGASCARACVYVCTYVHVLQV